MNKDRFKFVRLPYFILLIPLFFVLHGYNENFGLLDPVNLFHPAVIYCIGSIVTFLFIYLFNRNVKKSAIATAFILIFFFFFGYTYDYLRNNPLFRPIGRYIVLIPLFLLLSFLFFRVVVKADIRQIKFVRYLNLLFGLFVVFDLAGIVLKSAGQDQKTNLGKSRYALNYISSDSCNRPDIFLLVFDEYESIASLKDRYTFNSDIDSFLIRKGFNIPRYSRSNYYYTPFSIAAILNMSYITGIPDKNAVTIEDYANCNLLIADSEVARFLEEMGYQTVNYSIFDLKGNPSLIDESFLPVKTKLITDRTLFSKMKRDLEWNLTIRFPALLHMHYESYYKSNNKFLKLVKSDARNTSSRPRFIYAHFNLPHWPFFIDKNGKRRNKTHVYRERGIPSPNSYLEYVEYTNSEIKKIVNDIQQNNPSAVILLMGDHGFRVPEKGNSYPSYLFRNLNAVYIPKSDYSSFYDNITGVNQFRALFNEVFRQQISMLPDSVVYLKDKLRSAN